MSFRLRLTVLYALILTGFFLSFGLFSYFTARQTLLSAIDTDLEDTTVQVINSAGVFSTGDITLLTFPEEMDVFQTATLFMMAIDRQGNVLARSPNLENFEGTLDQRNTSQVQPTFTTVNQSGQRLRVLTYPLILDREGGAQLIGYLQMAQLLDSYDQSMNQLGTVLGITGGVVFMFFLFLGARTTHSLLNPLAKMTRAASQISRADDLSQRLPAYARNDEIGTLTNTLNESFERLEKLFNAQRRLLADVSHELRTPLTTIRGNIDLMSHMGELEPESIDIIQDELQRMTRLVGDLLLLARADGGSIPLRRHVIELETIVLDVYRQLQPLTISSNVNLILGNITPARIQGDPDKIKQLILILVDNALKYTPTNGDVNLDLKIEDNFVFFTVQDSGIGIPDEHLPYLFDRFYRVDKARSRALGGSGLGLSIAKWVTEAHRGRITVTSEVGIGTTFTVRFPNLPEAHFAPATTEETKQRTGTHRRISLPTLRSLD